MYLDEIVAAQHLGQARGIPSICSAHPWVLKAAMQAAKGPLLIEATCNQVNQFGGYTGMAPADFAGYIAAMAWENGFPFENIILGGDHLGPSVWQNEPAEAAMRKAEALVRAYVRAGFTKFHLDCSMRLGDDGGCALDAECGAERAARLARIVEEVGSEDVRTVIGSEVPSPGGATQHEEGARVTRVEDLRQTIALTQAAFARQGLQAAWERVRAVVVQPGVEFGDDFVLPYQPEAAQGLVNYIESEPQLVYEAHSTDYQKPQGLRRLVQDHFAILKVGPALSFAFREGAFALAEIEDELFPAGERSDLIAGMDEAMRRHPEHWQKYYQGTEDEVAWKRKYSLSDRVRYYWPMPAVQARLKRLLDNLGEKPIPLALLEQFMPAQCARIREGRLDNHPQALLLDKIESVLAEYFAACGVDAALHAN
jgi:D-tagatose-1,6-bisphosphate aldolase subunit GatZ/KbaZ